MWQGGDGIFVFFPVCLFCSDLPLVLVWFASRLVPAEPASLGLVVGVGVVRSKCAWQRWAKVLFSFSLTLLFCVAQQLEGTTCCFSVGKSFALGDWVLVAPNWRLFQVGMKTTVTFSVLEEVLQ